MAFRGKPSTAHVYDRVGQCTYCGTYKNVIDKLANVCTLERERIADAEAIKRSTNGKQPGH